MRDDNYEPSRQFGGMAGPNPNAWQGEEYQRILGAPADSFGPIDPEFKLLLRHPVKAIRRWNLRRRFGVYAPDEEDEPTT